MSYEIAGRVSWLVSWLDHRRGHAYADHSSRAVATRPRTWTHWLNNLSSDRAGDGEQLISQTLAARHLKESVEQLPSHERQVLLLHVNNGLTYWEIAARLGMDEEVVLRDLAHAYSQLRLELSMDELRR
jgi:RNA polymerase sigma factor (sigma-70 family)